jgi:mRNA interferase RelE/StbE
MTSFKIIFKQSVSKDLRRIPNQEVAKILNRLEVLAAEPRLLGAEILSSQEKYRIRQGVVRIIYEVVDKELIVVIIKVGHRRDVYSSI